VALSSDTFSSDQTAVVIWRLLDRVPPAYAASPPGQRCKLRPANDKAAMRKRVQTGLAAFFAALALVAATGPARAVDCGSRWLGETQLAICKDAALSRNDEYVVRRVSSLSRRLSYGQYLGLRYWHALWGEERGRCNLDRGCLTATYRVQQRFLDRLQQCLDTSQLRRTCFRSTLNVDREAQRRSSAGFRVR
jgi:uncharacterized protein